MAVMAHPEVYYSFRPIDRVVSPDRTDTRVLASIEALLVSAGDSFRARRYLEAISSYNAARSLIWSQLYPTRSLDEQKAAGVDLTRMLVSYGNEWLNVLPVEESVSGVRPREDVELDAGPLLGLRSAKIDARATDAAADLEVAAALEDHGDAKAAEFFRDRARTLAGDLVDQISAQFQPAPQPGPVPVGPTPAPPVPPLSTPPVVAVPRGGLTEHPFDPARNALAVGIQRDYSPVAFTVPEVVGTVPVVPIPDHLTVEQRSYVVPAAAGVAQVEWNEGDAPAVDDLVKAVYESRVGLEDLRTDVLLWPARPADVAIAMAHAWYYETPLGLAECYHALGQWQAAEQWYLKAATYQYLNTANEAPYLWGRMAGLYLDWGNSLFRDDDPQAAKPVYEKVITIEGKEPGSELYTIEGLKPGADAARDVLAHLDSPDAITASPTFTSVVFDVWSQLNKIKGGLDFWGHWANNIPIWTFDYLQSVAITFSQLAISAERDAMSFWEKADAGELTRTQLVQNAAQAQAERETASRQAQAAQAEVVAFQYGQEAANLRAKDAQDNAAEYASKSWAWTLHQAQSAQLAGGDDGDAGQLNNLADQMMSGPYSISGDRGTLSAAEQLTASRIQREYEVDSLKRQAAEMQVAAQQAGAELAAANARSAAAYANLNAASVRVQNAQELIAAFDDQRFTPDVWNQLGQKMGQISGRYLDMALDVAKRMQRAYNFENDASMAVIKPDYSSDAVQGFLAADSLLADIQSFTYDMVTATSPKPQAVRQTISLAGRYPYLFESQLRTTGRMQFQTTMDDFDLLYPGTYAGRIEYVEVAVDGIVPARGLSGTLSNDGISTYRTPAAVQAENGVKYRVQSRETQVLSDYDPRADALLADSDRRRRRVFEGAGVASSWTLELPPDVNELDYQAIVDVRLTLSYEARFDPDLRESVLAELATRPQAHERQRPLPLRWLYPDAFFAFYDSGVLDLTLRQGDFAATERSPVLTGLSLVAVTTPRARAKGIKLKVTAPGKPPIAVTTAEDGTVAEDDLDAVAGADALGAYRIELAAADNPDWVTDGKPALDAIDNISLILGYSFTPRS